MSTKSKSKSFGKLCQGLNKDLFHITALKHLSHVSDLMHALKIKKIINKCKLLALIQSVISYQNLVLTEGCEIEFKRTEDNILLSLLELIIIRKISQNKN